MEYDVFFVDWDGTLSGSRFWEGWSKDPARMSDHELIQERFFETPPNLLEDWMRGRLNVESAVEEVSRRTGLKSIDVLQGLRESCERIQFLDIAILGIIAEMRRRGSRVVIATDNMDTFTRWTVPSLGLTDRFDAILDSHCLRALKKDKKANGQSAFFESYFTTNNVDPSRTILIDDSLNNTVVQDFGMRYVRVTQDNPATTVLTGFL